MGRDISKEGKTINIEIPPHYLVVAKDLKKLMQRIGDGLLHRPVVGKEPWDTAAAAGDYDERVTPAFKALVSALQELSHEVLAPGASPLDEKVRQVMDNIATPLDDLIQFLRDLWQRPFKSGQEPGRPLLAAMVERPLRDVNAILDQIVRAIEDPDALVKEQGTANLSLRFELRNEEEERAFAQWWKSVSRRGWHRGSYGIGALLGLAAAFILGSWWGGD